MRKQKRQASPGRQGKQKRYAWKQQQFSELYPNALELPSGQPLAFTLRYRSYNLSFSLPLGLPHAHIPYYFHQQIYNYLLSIRDPNPLLHTAEIVGFSSSNGDLLLQYRVAMGEGTIERGGSWTCINLQQSKGLKGYRVLKCLAIGGFSKVYLVRSLKDGQFYAMKVMLKQFILQNEKASIIENEKQISAMMNHPFVVRLNHCFETPRFVCFVLDYCPGGELFFLLRSCKRMEEQHARFYFIEILYGLMYLHQQRVVYRDLKPENLLIGIDGHIKIADFGLSKLGLEGRDVTYSFCGSTEYMPPEMIQRSGHSYGVDFYTLGALLYELVTGLPPFYSRDEQQIKKAIVNQELTFPDHVTLSVQIRSLLTGLLQKNPKLRLGSMKGLKEILFHPWVGRVNSEAVLEKKMQPPHLPSFQEFNFDENELGEDQQEFTEALLHEHQLPFPKDQHLFKNFEFNQPHPLKPEVQLILNKYKQAKPSLKTCSSAKSLKKSTSPSVSTLKRKSSTPCLRSESTRKTKGSSVDHPFKSKSNLTQASFMKKQSATNSSWMLKTGDGVVKGKGKENGLKKKGLKCK